MKRLAVLAGCAVFLSGLAGCQRPAQTTPAVAKHPFSHCRQIIFGCYTEDLAQFRSFAERAKALRATHITITAEDLPNLNCYVNSF